MSTFEELIEVPCLAISPRELKELGELAETPQQVAAAVDLCIAVEVIGGVRKHTAREVRQKLQSR